MAAADRNPELERAIEARPDDPEPYLVFGDWLIARGDPRGELVALMHRFGADWHPFAPDGGELKREIGRRFGASRRALMGPLADLDEAAFYALWRWGFVRRLELHRGDDRLLGSILEHPCARFLRELTIPRSPRQVERLCRRGFAPATLRVLTVFGGDGSYAADGIFEAVPSLEILALGGVERTGPIAHERLRELRLVDASLDAAVGALVGGRLPALESLTIGGAGVEAIPDAFSPLLADPRAALPALQELFIVHPRRSPPLLRTLLGSPLLGRLRRLGVTGLVESPDLQTLLEHRAALAHLERLQLDPIRVDDGALLEQVRAIAKEVVGPYDDPGGHFE